MIRAESLKRLTQEVVLDKLSEHLESSGFKYLKSKRVFKRAKGNFDQIITFGTPHSPLEFNDQKDELSLKLHINFKIESPKFDKWVEQKLKQKSRFNHSLENIKCYKILDFNQLEKEDFFNPSESRKFKNHVTSSLIGPDSDQRINLDEIDDSLSEVVARFNTLDSVKNLVNGFQSLDRFLVFENDLESAKDFYNKTYVKVKTKIEKELTNNKEDAKRSIQFLERYSNEAKLLLDLEFENPFKREIKFQESKNQQIRLCPKLGYIEHLRFDISMINIQSFDINDDGHMMMLTDDRVLQKVGESGEIIEIGKLRTDDWFRNSTNLFEVKWHKEANSFSCNNFIITSSDEIIELPLKLDAKKLKPNSINPNIRELIFDKENNQFQILFTPNYKGTYHFIYDYKGKLLSTNFIEKNCHRINLRRKEIIVNSEGNSFDITTFQGEVKANYKYGNGNDRITLSPDGQLMLFHFYSTKSQLYDLKKDKRKVLWAHPTHLKGYKEKFYNDIHHNFGLTYATFTPDGNYIIGGADHGKYVVWDTKSFERKELVPSIESREIFNWFTTTFKDGKSTNNYFKPYVAKIEEQEMFINRGYGLSKISFIDEGTYFVSQVSDCLLTWDEEFVNIGHVYGIGNVTFSNSNYLGFKTNEELVLFKRVPNFNDNFQSSVFKEIKGEDSSISNLVIEEIENEQEVIKERLENSVNQPKEKKKGFFSRIFKR